MVALAGVVIFTRRWSA
ncbi:hypothetical protein [Halospeciosus flavus]